MHRGIMSVGVLATLAALSGCSDNGNDPMTAPGGARYLFSNMAVYGAWIGTTKQDAPVTSEIDSIIAVFRLEEMEFYTKRGGTWTRDIVEAYGRADTDVGFRTPHPEPMRNRLYYGTRFAAQSPADPDTIAGWWLSFGAGALGEWRVWYVGPPD